MQNVVVIGASNVTLALPLLWTTLLRSELAPVRVFVLAGHGRSFGLPSTVLGRMLPSILQSGFWEAFRSLPPQAGLPVIMTDVGNDLLYGVPVPQIDRWLRECCGRLAPLEPNFVMTELPVCALETLSRARFELFRRVLFPTSRLTFENGIRSGVELNRAVRRLAADYSAQLVVPQGDWYGFDPIHIRRSHRRTAWQEILRQFHRSIDCSPTTSWDCLQAWRARPELRWQFGRRIEVRQPVVRRGGSELWIF